MSQQNEGLKTFLAAEALEAFRRVKLSSGSGDDVEYADAGEAAIGVTQEKVSSGDPVVVRLLTPGKTFKMVASEALDEGATVYAADDGKVSDTSTGTACGTALEAATADGDVIEVLPKNL